MDSQELVEELEEYPELKEHFVELLKIVKNKGGSIELADDAEDRVIEAGRRLNHEALLLWAQNQVKTKSREFEKRHQHAHKDIKKK